jgi:starvation-inducible DNA-binding protein
MDELVNLMNKLLADTFAVYLKSHYYHWNVEGSNFPQYHEFLNELYEELYGSIDDIAEHIRQLDAYAPGTLARYKELTSVQENTTMPMPARDMFDDLNIELNKYYNNLLPVYKMAELFSEYGLSNFIQDRMIAIKKHLWMIKATLKDME